MRRLVGRLLFKYNLYWFRPKKGFDDLDSTPVFIGRFIYGSIHKKNLKRLNRRLKTPIEVIRPMNGSDLEKTLCIFRFRSYFSNAGYEFDTTLPSGLLYGTSEHTQAIGVFKLSWYLR